MDEFLGNMDLSYASQYFYIDEDDVLRCMLPWDYDWTLGSAIEYYNNKAANGIMAYRFGGSWFQSLIKNEDFRKEVVHVLDSRFTDCFFEKLSTHLYSIGDQIATSRKSDMRRWQDEWPYGESDVSSGTEDVEDFCQLFSDYFPERCRFLIDYFRDTESYCLVVFNGYQYGNFCVLKREKLAPYIEGANILNGFKPGEFFLGWFTEDGLTPEDFTVVTEDILFTARFASQTEE